MPTIVACPSCGGKLRVADNLLGRKVRCPTCHSTFATAAPPLPAARGPAPAPAPESAAPPAPGWLNLSLDSGPVASGPEGGSSASAGPGGLVGAVEVQTTPGGAPSPIPQAPTEPAPPSSPPPERGERPAPQLHGDLKECPGCGRPIDREAHRCYHCGEFLADVDDLGLPRRGWREPRRRDLEPHRGGLVLGLGITSLVTLVLCPLVGAAFGIVSWVLGQGDLRKINAGQMEPDGRGITQAGLVCGVLGTVLNGLLVIACMGLYGLMYYAEVNSSQMSTRPKYGPPSTSRPWQPQPPPPQWPPQPAPPGPARVP